MDKQQMLRILVVGVSWPPETFLARLFRGLAAAGHHITLAVPQKPEPEWLHHANIKWLHTPAWRGSIAKRIGQLAIQMPKIFQHSNTFLPQIAKHVKTGKTLAARLQGWHQFLPFASANWDVIYFPWNSAAIRHLPLFDLGIPTVVSCRGAQVNIAPHNPERYAIRQGLAETFERATAVHCVSIDIENEASKYGLLPAKTHVIRPAVDPNQFQPPATRPQSNGLQIVTTGSLIWRKGYEYALMAMRLLHDGGVPFHFHIIGEGAERQRLLYTIDDLALTKHVTLHGRLSSDQVLHRLQQADLFLLSSLSEGISNAALEAMATGLPIVTTDCGGMEEAVFNGLQGYVVPMRQPHAMAKAIQHLWQQPEVRLDMGRAARKRILQTFSLDRQIDAFEMMFERVSTAVEEPPRLRVSPGLPGSGSHF